MGRSISSIGIRQLQRTVPSIAGLLLVPLALELCHGQAVEYRQSNSSTTIGSPLSPAGDGRGYVLRVKAREVVLEVVARDRNEQPINDLNASDFEVVESTGKGHKEVRPVSGFRSIDPDSEAASGDQRRSLVVLPLGGRCEIRSTLHYELAFHPSNWSSGIHRVVVTTHRKHVTLSYRSTFYVGLSAPSQPDVVALKPIPDGALQSAACYHSDVPPSIPMSITEVANGNRSTSQYVLSIAPDALSLAGINEEASSVRLDYGICTFSKTGQILGTWRVSVDKPLQAVDRDTLKSSGWTEAIEIPRRSAGVLTRLVVRNPENGNLGSMDVVADAKPRTRKSTVLPEDGARHRLALPESFAVELDQHVGGRLSLGSPLPAPHSLCGDVYELPQTTAFLPTDFKKLNAVGAVYTNALSIPESFLRQGIPGSTPRTEWFGVDYYGEFWITKPGRYEFVLSADDGADLYIDGQWIINDDGIHPPRTLKGSVTLDAGRHTIHLPYFQGPTFVSLVLQVKPPDGILDVFDLRDYKAPVAVAQ